MCMLCVRVAVALSEICVDDDEDYDEKRYVYMLLMASKIPSSEMGIMTICE